MIQPSVAHIEGLMAHKSDGGPEDRDNCLGYIIYMNKWAPLLSVEDCDETIFVGFSRKQVHYKVESRSRRVSKNRREPQDRGMKLGGTSFDQSIFRVHFGFGIERDRLHCGPLVHQC